MFNMMAILVLAFSVQGPAEPYPFKVDTSKPYRPFQPDSLNVKLLSYVEDTTISILDLAASEDGDYIYAACGRNGLVIYDISDPRNPFKLKTGDSLNWVYSVAVKGHFLYFSLGSADSMIIADISTPSNPVIEGVVTPWGGYIQQMIISDTLMYCARGPRVVTFSISDPTNPSFLGQHVVFTFANVSSISVLTTILYAIPEEYGDPNDSTPVYLFDVSDPTNIVKINEIWLPGGQMSCVAAWKDTFNFFLPTYGHTFLYVLGGIWADYIWDVTDPLNPELVWEAHIGGTPPGQIHLHSKFSYIAFLLEIYDREIEPEGFHEVGYYRGLNAGAGKPLWANGNIIEGFGSIWSPGRLAIFQFSGDTVPSDTTDTTNPYISWVRTVYDYPRLDFTLEKEAQVSFSLYTVLGSKAHYQDLGLLEPGLHTIGLPNMR
ncbi:MAG: LVIVD repeat-containing protein, partial [Candidatus Hydrothermia bacterium]